jgi:phosphoglycerate dehydrogenase-like enzyme
MEIECEVAACRGREGELGERRTDELDLRRPVAADQFTATLGVANRPMSIRTPSRFDLRRCSEQRFGGARHAPNPPRRRRLVTVGRMAVLFCSDTFWDDHGDDIVAIDPTTEVVRLVDDQHVTPTDLERITIAFFSGDTWPERSASFLGACTRAPNLEWLQSFSAGTDHPIFGAIRDGGATVTNSAGSSAPSIAQTVMLYLLALSRDLPRLGRAQNERRWSPGPSRDLHGLRLGVVGLGAIGTEVARLADTFEMEVVGLRRSVRGDEPCETWPSDRVDELLGWADAIVVAAPLTTQTSGMFGTDAFAAMRRGAWFVNVGRGEIVDELALADALSSGHLGGAGLDVFATEPLPRTSPLWDLPNVIITPHSSGNTDRSRERSVQQFLDNFRRRTNGEPLRNVTDD